MSGGGGKGGSNTSAQSIPEWVSGPAQENLAQARVAGQIGYMPYYGPEVAGLSPMQQQSMQNTHSGLQAFGLAPEGQYQSGLPPAQTFAGGVQGYSSGNLFDQAVAELALRQPEIAAQYKKFYSQPDAPPPPPAAAPGILGMSGGSGGYDGGPSGYDGGTFGGYGGQDGSGVSPGGGNAAGGFGVGGW